MRVFSFLILLLAIVSCSRTTNERVSALSGEMIKVNFSKTDGIAVSAFADSISYLSLELGNEIIGEVSKLIYADSRYFISDKTTGTILVFDQSGGLEQSIRQQGAGPGEYRELTDFFVDESSSTLTVFSRASQQLLELDYAGGLKSQSNLGHYLDGISPLGNGGYLTFGISPDAVEGMLRPSGVSLLDVSVGLKNTNLYAFSGDLASYNAFQYRYFHKGRDKHFLLTASDTLFSYSASGGLQSDFVFDFGSQSIPASLKKMPNTPLNTNMLMEGGYLRSKDHFIDHSDFLSFHVADDEFSYFAFYAKNTEQAEYANVLMDDINGLPLTFPIASDGSDRLFSILPQESLLSTLTAFKEYKSQIVESRGEEGYRTMVERLSGLISNKSEVLAVMHTQK